MWIKQCPVCNGTRKNSDPPPITLSCQNCQGTGAVPSTDPADEYNEQIVDNSGNWVIVNVPPQQ
jgi:DnaJ-class molecular chaperone